jgi:DnaK suppressor protein
MTNKLRQEFIEKERQKLVDEQTHVRDELRNLREALQSEVDVEPDEGDAEVFEREKNSALIAVLEKKLNDVEAALKSIEKGGYGICEDCGKAIETERLEVKPDATLCLTCQQKAEQRARRNRPVRQIDW